MPSPSAINDIWPQEKIDALREHWISGIPASEIGAQMGISKNAVLGKVHKLKLTPRLLGGPRSNVKSRADKPNGNKGKPKAAAIVHKLVTRAERKPPTPPESFDMEDGEGVDVTALVGIMDLTANTCRWPHGDPLLPGFGYCGKYTDAGPYCADHAKRATRGGRNA